MVERTQRKRRQESRRERKELWVEGDKREGGKKAGKARKKGSKKASRKGGGNTGTKEGKEKVWEGKGGLERKAGRQKAGYQTCAVAAGEQGLRLRVGDRHGVHRQAGEVHV